MRLDVSQAIKVGASLTGAGARAGVLCAAALRRTAFAIQADAQAAAPVDTGALRSSISTTITGSGSYGAMTAEIGPTVEYGIYQELGTSTQPGQPYLGPAFDRQVDGLVAAITQIGGSSL